MNSEVSVLSHVTNSAVVICAIQWLKGTERYRRFAAWLPVADRKVHVLASMLGAAFSALGMHGSVTGHFLSGVTIALTIPPAWVIFHAVWDWMQQVALNWLLYAGVVQQKQVAPVVTAQVSDRVSVTASVKSLEVDHEQQAPHHP